MVDVDRRAMFGVAGLAVAGLGLNVVGSTPAVAGVDRQFGIDPRSPLPPSPAFAPRRMCVVMIGMGSKISHKLAHYQFPAAISEVSGEAAAGEVIRYHLAVGAFPQKAASGNMIGAPADLNSLGSTGQERFYFYLTGTNVEFGPTNNNAIRFTEFNYQELPAAPNVSFFEARLVNIAGVPKKVQCLSNLFVGSNGELLSSQSPMRRNSINIVTLLQSSIGAPLPIIIDPWVENPRPAD